MSTDPAQVAPPLRLLAVQNDPTDPPALLGEWWAEVGVDVVVLRADAGEPVPTELPDGIDGLVVLGGEMAAWEDHRRPVAARAAQPRRDGRAATASRCSAYASAVR